MRKVRGTRVTARVPSLEPGDQATCHAEKYASVPVLGTSRGCVLLDSMTCRDLLWCSWHGPVSFFLFMVMVGPDRDHEGSRHTSSVVTHTCLCTPNAMSYPRVGVSRVGFCRCLNYPCQWAQNPILLQSIGYDRYGLRHKPTA